MNYKIITKNQAPIEVQEWLEENKKSENHTVISVENKMFAVITRGEKKTGGYSIELLGVEEQDNIILIRIKCIDPKPDEFVTQIISYPYLIVEIEKTNKEVKIVIEN